MFVVNRLLSREKILNVLRRQLSRSVVANSPSSDLVWMSKANNSSNNDTKVLVCGWAGSKKTNVEKYTDLFARDFGLNCFGCIIPMADFMSFDQYAQSKFTSRVLEQVAEQSPESKVKLVC